MQSAPVKTSQISTPAVKVTGTVVASVRPEGEKNEWQFSDPDVLTNFTEWMKRAE